MRQETQTYLCVRCDEFKEFDAFSPRKSSPLGRYTWCRKCMSSYISGRYKTNPKHREQVKAAVRKYEASHPEAKRRSNAARRAREISAPTVPYTREQLAQRWEYYGGKCWMCGQQADCTDHVKPLAKGGAEMLCNMRPACTPCNGTKLAKWPYRRGVEF